MFVIMYQCDSKTSSKNYHLGRIVGLSEPELHFHGVEQIVF